MSVSKCHLCGSVEENLYSLKGHPTCDLCLLDISKGILSAPKVTKCPVAFADGYGSLQPDYIVSSSSKKPNLDEQEQAMNHFVPQVL